MALDWHLIESEANRESVLQKLSSSLERATPSKNDVLRVEALLRDTSIPTDLRRNVSRALLKHTRRESTQRLPMLWTASSSDEEFRATDEIVMFDATAVVPNHVLSNEIPTAERNWDDMPLPADATDGSGILTWSADDLLKFVPDGPHTLRFHRRVYEDLSRENTLALLRRGMLLGMDVFGAEDWVRIVDHPDFSMLVTAFEDEAIRVMSRCDIRPELETLEDLLATSDITRPLDPDPSFPFEDLDTLFDDEPQTVELANDNEDDNDDDDDDDFTTKFEETERTPRRLPPGPLEHATSFGIELDRQGDTLVARPSKSPNVPVRPVPRAVVLDEPAAAEEAISLRRPAAEVKTARLSAIPIPPLSSTADHESVSLLKSETRGPVKTAVVVGLLGLSAIFGLAYTSKPVAHTVTLIAPEPSRAIGEAIRIVDEASQIGINDSPFLIQAASDWSSRGRPEKSAKLLELSFKSAPSPGAAIEISRMHARAGSFVEARRWLRDASRLGAPDPEIVALLSESFREDRSLRDKSLPLTLKDEESLKWDSTQRHFQILKKGVLSGYFVPNWRGRQVWAEQVAESRLCDALDCAHRVPNAHPAHIHVGAMKLPRGVRLSTSGSIEGAFVEAPQVGLTRTPVEMQNVWSGWLSADSPMPSGPYASRLLAWDRLDPNLRPDFANLAAPTVNALEFSRQVSSLFVVDALLRNNARAERRSTDFGHTTGFDGTHLVSLRTSSMPARMPSRLLDRLGAIERVDKFEWLALQAMSPDNMFGVFDALNANERKIIWQERQGLVDRYSKLIQKKGALNVLMAR